MNCQTMAGKLIVLLVSLAAANGVHWSYDDSEELGPANWEDVFPLCKGDQQSPIDIVPDDAIVKPDLMPFGFTGYDADDIDMTLFNNGHAAVISINGGGVSMWSGSLPGDDTFELAQFHFHWGADNEEGSEHTVDGKSYPAEFHFVHFNKKYGDLTTAINKTDGLAVLGVFVKAEDDDDNEAFDHIVDNLENIPDKDDEIELPSFRLESLLPRNLDSYYRYHGSLTTPACYETVTWTVFHEPVHMSAQQIAAFRQLKGDGDEEKFLLWNYRPTQPLGERSVWTSKHPAHPPVGAGNLSLINLALLAAILALQIVCKL